MVEGPQKHSETVPLRQLEAAVNIDVLNTNLRLEVRRELTNAEHAVHVRARGIDRMNAVAERLQK
jgi:hypothetical protein